MENKFIVTSALKKIYKAKKRIVVCQSGTYTSKTYSILAILIDIAARQPKTRITVCGETISSIKSGTLNDFKNIMETTERWIDDHFNHTDRIYTFGNGSTIQFTSYDNPTKAKASGKRNILFLNEANNIPWHIANELITRTSDRIYVDFNPTSEFWAHTELMTLEECEVVKLHYRDNEAIPENIVRMLESRIEKAETSEYWKKWCKIYIDGEVGSLDGLVFEDYQIIDMIPENVAEIMGYGLDFGFTNDPTTLIEIWKWGDSIILNEILYRTQMTNLDIIKFIKDSEIKGLIVADSSEPKSIEEIKRAGINIIGAIKGPDSVNNGLDLMRRNDLYITSNSTNLIKEIKNYCWITDNEGKSLNTPIDDFNHGIDASRYLITYLSIKSTNGRNRTFNF